MTVIFYNFIYFILVHSTFKNNNRFNSKEYLANVLLPIGILFGINLFMYDQKLNKQKSVNKTNYIHIVEPSVIYSQM